MGRRRRFGICLRIVSDLPEEEFCKKIAEWIEAAKQIGEVEVYGWMEGSDCLEVQRGELVAREERWDPGCEHFDRERRICRRLGRRPTLGDCIMCALAKAYREGRWR